MSLVNDVDSVKDFSNKDEEEIYDSSYEINNWDDLDNDPNILSVLSSNMSQDAYELYLYPKAKTQSVTNVIKNYTKYFKPINSTSKLSVPY